MLSRALNGSPPKKMLMTTNKKTNKIMTIMIVILMIKSINFYPTRIVHLPMEILVWITMIIICHHRRTRILTKSNLKQKVVERVRLFLRHRDLTKVRFPTVAISKIRPWMGWYNWYGFFQFIHYWYHSISRSHRWPSRPSRNLITRLIMVRLADRCSFRRTFFLSDFGRYWSRDT